jgi:hypothetical protein
MDGPVGVVMTLTDHFALSEFVVSQTAARLNIDNTPPPEVVAALTKTAHGLEMIRVLLQCPIHISSGYRCLALNAAVGSKSTSQHTTGQAVDFTAPGFGTPDEVVKTIIGAQVPIPYDQIIVEFRQWVHISFSDKPRKQALVIDHDGTHVYA